MKQHDLADQILETALEIAETTSWEQLHLYLIAEKLRISLDQIRQIYPQKDDIVEAWFDRADNAVLNIQATDDFLRMRVHERLLLVIMTWFTALAPHRSVTRQMLQYKFEFGHIHLQALGVMRISRTVQWFRETARVNSTDLRRILEESATTAIYLMSFALWLNDDSVDSRKTRDFLENSLSKANCFAGLVSFS